MRSELGWSPTNTLQRGLRTTIEWYLSHLDWIKVLVEKEEFGSWMKNNYTNRGDAK